MALLQFQIDHGLSGQAIFLELPEAAEEDDVQMEVDKQLQEAEAQSSTKGGAGKVKTEGEPKDTQKETRAQRRESQSAATETPATSEPPTKDSSVSLPSRKRSQSAAGIPDAPEEDQGDTKKEQEDQASRHRR